MYSLNVPVPGRVARLASDLARDLPTATERSRGEHTLVAKRLEGGDYQSYHAIEARVRELLAGQPTFQARVTGLDMFEQAPAGTSPVVYLTVESPGLVALHERLCDVFDPVPGMESDEYTPHVTVARGGSLERARAVCAREIAPIEWTVDSLSFLDVERGRRGVEAGRVSLPA